MSNGADTRRAKFDIPCPMLSTLANGPEGLNVVKCERHEGWCSSYHVTGSAAYLGTIGGECPIGAAAEVLTFAGEASGGSGR